MSKLLAGLALVATLGALASGLMVVDSGHVGVVFRFGAVERVSPAGLGLHLPWPLERHEVVDVTDVRRVETGSQRLLTGDTNLVDLDLVIQYTAADPVLFLTAVDDPEALVASVTRAVSCEVVASLDVDALLTTGRAELQTRVASGVQERLEAMQTGIFVSGVELRELSPPPAVVDAFNEVSSARGDRQTLALAAESYASGVVPQARGQASQRIEQARSFASQRVAAAQGDVARFEALLPEDGPALRSQLRAQGLVELQAEVMVVPDGTEVVLPR